MPLLISDTLLFHQSLVLAVPLVFLGDIALHWVCEPCPWQDLCCMLCKMQVFTGRPAVHPMFCLNTTGTKNPDDLCLQCMRARCRCLGDSRLCIRWFLNTTGMLQQPLTSKVSCWAALRQCAVSKCSCQ